MYRKVLAAALTATMVGSMFSTVGAEEAKNIPTLTTDPLEITLWDISTEDPSKTICEDEWQSFTSDYPGIYDKQSSSAE